MEPAGGEPLEAENVLTVAELNAKISEVIDQANELTNIQCVGEVSEVSEYDWGAFINLVHDDHELTALMWASRYQQLDTPLEPGLEILLTGDIDFYAEDGTISLKPWQVAVIGDGDRALQLQQLRTELDERGWLDEEHKQDLPRFPQRIGVVTSLDGDARYDIEEAIHTRYPDVDICIADARVQGDQAPVSLASAIQTLDRQHEVDVIVVGRGGGSETDLAAFNSEPVAEAVFTAGTPVVAAVGHREDTPIVNDVADATAITPTEVGQLVVEDRDDVEDQLNRLTEQVDQAFQQTAQERLDGLEDRLDEAFETTAEEQLTVLEDRVDQAYRTRERQLEKQATRRKYGAIIAILLVILFAMGAYIILALV